MSDNKVPMAYAAQMLSSICEEIDAEDAKNSGEKIDALLLAAFGTALQHLAPAVDRRIAVNVWLKSQMAAAQEGLDFYQALMTRLIAVRTRFVSQTKEIIEANPGIPFEGRLGKISIGKNGGLQSIDYSFGSKIIDSLDTADRFGVPRDYIKTHYAVDSDRLRSELERGETFEWASLKERGTHVNFPRTKKDEPEQIGDK